MEILLVEDDIVDAMTVKRAAVDLKLQHNIVHVNNGQEALDCLLNNDNKYPDIILLDINMPVMDGIEFLKLKRKSKNIDIIPTVVLTTSNAETDRSKCYKLNISGYLIKPVDYQLFKEVYNIINKYWSKCESPVYQK